MSAGYYFSDREIARATTYIKDDKYLASIYGTKVYRVKRLRENATKPVVHKDDGPPIGYDCFERENLKMEVASKKLLEAIMNARGSQ